MRVQLIAAMTVFVGYASLAAVEQKTGPDDPSEVILDTGSFWRSFLVFRDPVFGIGQAAKPRELKKDLRWNSSLPPANWFQVEFDDSNWWTIWRVAGFSIWRMPSGRSGVWRKRRAIYTNYI